MASSLEAVEFLARSAHRVEALEALAEGPRSRSDLRAVTGASSSTVGRMLREFEARGWVVEEGRRYAATPTGAFVAGEVTGLLERMATRQRLRDVAAWLPTEALDVTIETFAGAVVTTADADAPYRPVGRFDDLIDGAATMRAFGTPTLASANAAALVRSVRAGMETELVAPPPVVEPLLDWSPEGATRWVARGALTVLVHDDLPCGLAIFDDRVALPGYDPDTGMLRAVVDTDAPAAREWAGSLYESYRSAARPLDPDAIAA